jgi:hypothetical protein
MCARLDESEYLGFLLFDYSAFMLVFALKGTNREGGGCQGVTVIESPRVDIQNYERQATPINEFACRLVTLFVKRRSSIVDW